MIDKLICCPGNNICRQTDNITALLSRRSSKNFINLLCKNTITSMIKSENALIAL